MLSVMVIGASQEPERVRAFMDRVSAHPQMELAHDWLRDIEEHGASVPDDEEVLRRCGEADLRGVYSADVLVALLPEHPATTVNMWVELGYALYDRAEHTNHWGENQPIVLSGDTSRLLYRYRDEITAIYDRDELAFGFLEGLAAEAAQ